jgi:hypothetical protein
MPDAVFRSLPSIYNIESSLPIPRERTDMLDSFMTGGHHRLFKAAGEDGYREHIPRPSLGYTLGTLNGGFIEGEFHFYGHSNDSIEAVADHFGTDSQGVAESIDRYVDNHNEVASKVRETTLADVTGELAEFRRGYPATMYPVAFKYWPLPPVRRPEAAKESLKIRSGLLSLYLKQKMSRRLLPGEQNTIRLIANCLHLLDCDYEREELGLARNWHNENHPLPEPEATKSSGT